HMLPKPPDPTGDRRVTLDTLFAGFRFMWRNEVLLGAMTLDLVATLFGGIQALLPIFARDILEVGPLGAGILRSSVAVGALATAAVLTRLPITRHAGRIMFGGVIVYGAAAIVFAFSTHV